MNKIGFMKRITLTLIALFMSTMMWAQSLTGEGTENNPYLISSAEDWNTFASSSDYWTSNVFVRLDADITVSTMVGTSSNKYCGTFDGNWHTLTFNNGSIGNPCTVEKCAPFSYAASGLTIKNLKVEGTIVSQKKYAAGLIGWLEGTGSHYITNCTSNITIDCSEIEKGTSGKEYDCSTGGFIGQIQSGKVVFENCVFSGLIDKREQNLANRCAGFVSYINNGSIEYTYCTMAGTIDMADYTSTFNRNEKNSFNEAYYINNYGDVSGCTLAPTTEPTGAIAKKYTVNSSTYYVPSAIVSGLETTPYSYIEGQPVTITPVVTYYGKTLTRGTDYIIKIDGTEVPTETIPTLSAAGDYTLTIEGKTGSSYAGSQSTTIHVVSYNTWAAVQEVLADASNGDRNITLSGNITPALGSDHYLEVNGNVVLNLNGKTIDRALEEKTVYGQVIRVSSGANLTINGPGTITGGYSWPGTDEVPQESTYYDKRDGGGIHNMGTLVLNNVAVEHNKCLKEEDGSKKATARGGGIYSGPGSSLTVNGGSVSSNEGRGGGGGVFCDRANPFVMTDVEIWSNGSDSKGGGLRIKTTGGAIAYLTDCDIAYWNAVSEDASQGGGIYLESGELVMTRCNIEGNASTKQGGGFFSKSGKTTAIDCTIINNGTYYYDSEDNYGGGVCLFESSVFIMDGGVIKENNCENNGGGIYVYNGAVFQVKGNVQIVDNLQAGMSAGLIGANNAYMAGNSVIEVIAPLGDDALIYITPNGTKTTYVTYADEASSGSIQTDLSHFAIDNNSGDDEYSLMIDDNGDVVVYTSFYWNELGTWNGTAATSLSGLPTNSDDITINRTVIIPKGYVAHAGSITLGDNGFIIIQDGGQLVHSGNVTVTFEKAISGYTIVSNSGDDKTNGWYTIATPITGGTTPSTINGLMETTSSNYDLYYYEEANHYWRNYKPSSNSAHPNFTLSNGQGYLYANDNDKKLVFTGVTQGTGNMVSVPLSYTENAGNLKGYNLVGNPFTRELTSDDVIKVGNTNLTTYYYVSNGNQIVSTTLSERSIKPGEGFLVQATAANQDIVFNYQTRGEKEEVQSSYIQIEAGDASFMDCAIVQFGQGNTLRKMYITDNTTKLYVMNEGKDWAATTVENTQGELPVCFRAVEHGTYTINVKHEGIELSYLHLIDNLTGANVDLLATPSYTFSARNDDYSSRFRLVYSADMNENDNENENFAFISNGEIIINGTGTLQVFDMLGHLVYSRETTSDFRLLTSDFSSGVYVLQLIQGSQVRNQKIIIK